MRRLLQVIGLMSRWERWALIALFLVAVLSTAGLLRKFYMENTTLAPAAGGTYIEGSVGVLQPLNPWFTVQNDVNRDIVSLVFSGLLRYDPRTRAIVDDLATMETSKDLKTYTLTLKENVFWQDSTESEPHPVTADDVLFTFQTIQDPEFPNTLLQENFRGVKLQKLDERTVRFTLETPYSFFPSNLTLGLVPRSSFEGMRIGNYDKIDPIGAGPYEVKSVLETELSSEVTLQRAARQIEPEYHLDRIVFRIFSDYSSLLADLRNLQGVRLVSRSTQGSAQIPRRFTAMNYYLPQYVALFFNMDRRALQDPKLRLGLQQGTDKQAVAASIGESVVVDTPLLQIDVSDWRYKFDAAAAQGALLASKWNIPERLRLQKLLEQDETNKTGVLQVPPVALLNRQTPLTFSGSYGAIPHGAKINGAPLREIVTNTGSWTATLPYLEGTGALKLGENLLRVTAPDGTIIDSAYVTVASTAAQQQAANRERLLMRAYVESKNGTGTGAKVDVSKLALEGGMLRLRTSADAPSVRVNERGERLHIRLLTTDAPAAYRRVAEEIRTEWGALGVEVELDIPRDRNTFQQKLLRRDYDVLLFGQSLLDNLDSYPYWHSTGVQKITTDDKDLRRDAYNLSQYSSFKADALLETVRRTGDEAERQKALAGLRDLLKNDAPAIFLYSPLYTYAHRDGIQGIELGSLSLHSDRFLSLQNWYVKEDRVFLPGKSWATFFSWLPGMLGGAGQATNGI